MPLSESTQFDDTDLLSALDEDPFAGLPSPNEPEIPMLEQLRKPGNISPGLRLENFCQQLENRAESKKERDYVASLRISCQFLEAREEVTKNYRISDEKCVKNILQRYLGDCEDYFKNLGDALNAAVTRASTAVDKLAMCTRHSPRTSPVSWLRYLHNERFHLLSNVWKAAVIAYGLAITQLHRAHRLVALSGNPVDLIDEFRHVGHTNWSPWDFPETLLFEAENGIMIREVQEVIAKLMRTPTPGTNSVCQLNMGDGKSSIIVPSVAATLADKKRQVYYTWFVSSLGRANIYRFRLVRIIVARAQSKQMLQMLVSKLGGLLNRRIYHMPFSRKVKLNSAKADAIRDLYKECMANGGIMLVQPEHILSFKLMGVECLYNGNHDVARSLLDTQQFFDTVSRDIVDECDENFSVKFELVYTMGSQRLVAFAPERWLIIRDILSLVPKLAMQVEKDIPLSIEIQAKGEGRFPRVRVLREDAADKLLKLLARHLVEYGLMGLPVRSQPPDIKEAVFQYISRKILTTEEVQAVKNSIFWNDSTRSQLLLIRGLIAGGVVRFVLMQKRWRVNYGLDQDRTPATKLAVPYRSKDCPSPRSEFSHTDVVILFTFLSYYYHGLTDEELFDNFAHLLRSDEAAMRYDEWIHTAARDLPIPFQHLSGVSVKDRVLCVENVFPFLRYSRAAIDYYLSHFVFPKEMKEFPYKVSASGWDVGAIKSHPTTGFSGTKDTLHILPLTVSHVDLPGQKHTDALVLGYLLQDETSVELLPTRTHAGATDAENLLVTVNRIVPEVRVILDVGAQILEMDNFEVAEKWLSMRENSHTQAVIFFHGEELSILDCKGRVETFQTSAFAKKLDVCLVYLDEAHTRGTDLKLPRNYRAAVTLGANLTKDRLVQACMRMRKLGHGQSVTFIVSQEISTKIKEWPLANPPGPIEVSDVLCWTITETWLDLRRSMPLWAAQGHCFEKHKGLLNGANTTETQAMEFLEDEAQSLEARYQPQTEAIYKNTEDWDLYNDNIKEIVSRCKDFEAEGFESATLQEEQEVRYEQLFR